MKIAGIDYSLRCPAICTFDGDKRFCVSKCQFYFMSPVKKYEDMGGTLHRHNIHWTLLPEFKHECERYSSLSEWALGVVSDCEHVCIEDYAFSAKGKVFHIGENTGIMKHKLWSRGIQYTTVPPTKIKKASTGRGNAKKEEVYACFVQETKLDLQSLFGSKSTQIKSPFSDIADAYYICKYGHYLAFKS